jgi:hypothetical protein
MAKRAGCALLRGALATCRCDAETDDVCGTNGLASSPIAAAYLKLRDIGIMAILDGMKVRFPTLF